ncbi:MAG: hypothetical protein MI919_15740 [Holophagales bacterium]|nr:hypothetical protein [Holophagales bacterium]
MPGFLLLGPLLQGFSQSSEIRSTTHQQVTGEAPPRMPPESLTEGVDPVRIADFTAPTPTLDDFGEKAPALADLEIATRHGEEIRGSQCRRLPTSNQGSKLEH